MQNCDGVKKVCTFKLYIFIIIETTSRTRLFKSKILDHSVGSISSLLLVLTLASTSSDYLQSRLVCIHERKRRGE